jgi:hypothetical protein
MMNGKGKGNTNLPTKEMQITGNRVIFIKTGMWNGSSVKMIKRRTVTLCTRKKEKQVLVHWLYKNEKTWQREAEVLPQLQVHYEDLLVREEAPPPNV